jgi:hypothetical protein
MQLDTCTAGAEHNKHSSMITYFEKCNELYSSPTIIRVIKSRIMRWVGHVASMREGRERCIHGFDGETLRKETTWKAQV